MNPERPALGAVLAALDGVLTPREAVEVLAARDLWPLENGPRVVGGDSRGGVAGARAVHLIASIASLGLAQIVTAEGLAREVLREADAVEASGVAWDLDDTLVAAGPDDLCDAARSLCAMGLWASVYGDWIGTPVDFRPVGVVLRVPSPPPESFGWLVRYQESLRRSRGVW